MSQSRTLQPMAAQTVEWVETCQFDAGQLTSDGGLAWVHQADMELAVCTSLAAQIPDGRHGPVHHSLETLVRQRVYQIACGDEDQNDATTVRTDPLLKLVCGRTPDSPADLASQPTRSRLENAVSARTCSRLAQALLGVYLQERERANGGRPPAQASGARAARPGGHRRSHPWGPGRQCLPRRLPAAYVSPRAHLRR